MTEPTAADVVRALYRHFTPRWAVLTEVTVNDPHDAVRRRVDVLLVRPTPRAGTGLDVVALEIKVTRSDFLRDAGDPVKQRAWREVALQHAYVTPPGLVRPAEIPDGSGLLEVDHAARWVRNAPKTPSSRALPRQVQVALLHRLAHAEGLLKGHGEGDGRASCEEDLRARIVAAAHGLHTANVRTRQLEDEVRAWQQYAAATGQGVPCAHCGKPIVPSGRVVDGVFSVWRHLNLDDAQPCQRRRDETHEDRCRILWEQLGPHARKRHQDAPDHDPDAPWRSLASYVKVNVHPGELAAVQTS